MQDAINDFITIWVIVDPIAALPIFIGLTGYYNKAERHKIALAMVLVALVVLIFFISLGQFIINAMGVSLLAFEIAGGLILFLFAVDLVIGEQRQKVAEAGERLSPMQRAIYPLAIPNLAGPGAMLTVMLRTDNSRSTFSSRRIPPRASPRSSPSPMSCCCWPTRSRGQSEPAAPMSCAGSWA